MRIIADGLIQLDEGEMVPAKCQSCGFVWNEDWQAHLDRGTELPIVCPLCEFENKLSELPEWEQLT